MTLICDSNLISGWDCYDWRNGRAILEQVHSKEWREILSVMKDFRLYHSALAAKGKNKTETSKAIDGALYSLGWREATFDTKVTVVAKESKAKKPVINSSEYDSPTHSVDCLKGKVAVELEWNNKDPFYDRDLNNFRLLFDLRAIEVGVVVTRATSLQQWLHARHKLFMKDSSTFGASTTHFDKLETRVIGGGAGGCPLFIFSMTEQLYVDDR